MAVRNSKKSEAKTYDKTYQIKPLKMMVVIVNKYQGEYFIDSFKNFGISATFLTYAKGTATKSIRKVLNVDAEEKDVIIALVKNSEVDKLLKLCKERFNTSSLAAGVAFTISVDSMIGVLLYKFFTDTKQNRRK